MSYIHYNPRYRQPNGSGGANGNFQPPKPTGSLAYRLSAMRFLGGLTSLVVVVIIGFSWYGSQADSSFEQQEDQKQQQENDQNDTRVLAQKDDSSQDEDLYKIDDRIEESMRRVEDDLSSLDERLGDLSDSLDFQRDLTDLKIQLNGGNSSDDDDDSISQTNADILKALGYEEVDLLRKENSSENSNLKSISGYFELKVRINGQTQNIYLLLDTGANITSLDLAQKDVWGIENTVLGEVTGVGGTQTVEQASVTLSVVDSGIMLSNFPVVLMDFSGINQSIEKTSGNFPIDGLVGDDFLNRTNAIIDYTNSKIYLQL